MIENYLPQSYPLWAAVTDPEGYLPWVAQVVGWRAVDGPKLTAEPMVVDPHIGIAFVATEEWRPRLYPTRAEAERAIADLQERNAA